MLTLLPIGAQTKVLKFFCLKFFSICHRCQRHRWCTLSREYLREFSKKFEMAVMVYSDAWGKLIHEKNQKSKISWHCPFKGIVPQYFRLQDFFMNQFTPLGPVSNLFENSRRYLRRKVHHRCTTEYLREFSKIFAMTLKLFSGPWAKKIHEENPK